MRQLSQTGRFFRRWWPALLTGAVMLVAGGVVGLVALIESSAHLDALAAQREFRGDGVEALVQLVESEHQTLRERNRAVWAQRYFATTTEAVGDAMRKAMGWQRETA